MNVVVRDEYRSTIHCSAIPFEPANQSWMQNRRFLLEISAAFRLFKQCDLPSNPSYTAPHSDIKSSSFQSIANDNVRMSKT